MSSKALLCREHHVSPTNDKQTCHKKKQDSDNEEEDESSEEEEAIACCLCHCAVDYADREAFFGDDDDEDDNSNNNMSSSCASSSTASSSDTEDGNNNNNSDDDKHQLLLPKELYDPNNNIVLCDGCDRAYHQQCHFVPLIALPRGTWYCLICRYQRDYKTKTSTKKTTTKHHHHHQHYRTLTNAQLKQIYTTPPTSSGGNDEIQQWQEVFELETSLLKANLWKRELTIRLPSKFQQQLGQIRLSQNTLRAYTSTHRARRFLSKNSQELCQAFATYARAKLVIRHLFLSIQNVLQDPNAHGSWNMLEEWILQHCTSVEQQEEQELKWFPFGMFHPRRLVPRFEGEGAAAAAVVVESSRDVVVPPVVMVERNNNNNTRHSKTNTQKQNVATSHPNNGGMATRKQTAKQQHDDDDSSDMISLDDLRCSICFKGDSSDTNDVLLCDGQGCFRAYHMHCVSPHVSIQEATQNEEDDWFCPICKAISHLIFNVQAEYMGDEWEKRHFRRDFLAEGAAAARHNKRDHEQGDVIDDDDDDTVKSWDCVADVFPEAEKELAAAKKWKKGRQDEEADALISSVLGIRTTLHNDGEVLDDDDDDEEEDIEDDEFDLDAFHADKQLRDDDSSVSSQATLADMSSVELEIGRQELDALSSCSSEEDDDENSGPSLRRPRRRARRARSTTSDETSERSSSKPDVDIGTLDESNIVYGKRNRTKVDYRRLNDSMFGLIPDEEAVKLFDDRDDEFRVNSSVTSSAAGGKRPRKLAPSSSSSSSEEDSSRPAVRRQSKRKRGRPRKYGATSSDASEDEESEQPVRKNGIKQRKASSGAKKKAHGQPKKSSRPPHQNGSKHGRAKTRKDAALAQDTEKSPRGKRRGNMPPKKNAASQDRGQSPPKRRPRKIGQ